MRRDCRKTLQPSGSCPAAAACWAVNQHSREVQECFEDLTQHGRSCLAAAEAPASGSCSGACRPGTETPRLRG